MISTPAELASALKIPRETLQIAAWQRDGAMGYLRKHIEATGIGANVIEGETVAAHYNRLCETMHCGKMKL